MFIESEIPEKYRENRAKALVDPKLFIVKSDLMTHCVTQIRKKSTGTEERRKYNAFIARRLMEESVDLPMHEVVVETPVGRLTTYEMDRSKELALTFIMGAGISMMDEAVELFPDAAVFIVAMHRDEVTREPIWHYKRIPGDVSDYKIKLADPMLATGGSAIATIDLLNERGAKDENISMYCIFAAPEGVLALHAKHPDVKIFTAALDWGLDDNAFIVPGEGDHGNLWLKNVPQD